MKEVEWKFELNVDYAQNFEISLCDESLFLWKIMSLKAYVYSLTLQAFNETLS